MPEKSNIQKGGFPLDFGIWWYPLVYHEGEGVAAWMGGIWSRCVCRQEAECTESWCSAQPFIKHLLGRSQSSYPDNVLDVTDKDIVVI